MQSEWASIRLKRLTNSSENVDKMMLATAAATVWPDLTKFSHFGTIFPVIFECFEIFDEILHLLWYIWKLFFANFYISGRPIYNINIENVLAIWTHC